MSRKTQQKALVFRAKRAGDADLFLRVITESGDLLGCFARSARKQKSKLGPLLTPPSLGELELVESKSGDSYTVTGFELEDSFPATETGLTASLIANFWSQVLSSLPLGIELGEPAFETSTELLKAAGERDAAPLLARALWTLLDELGAVEGSPADHDLLLIDPEAGSVLFPSEGGGGHSSGEARYLAIRRPVLTALATALSPSGGSAQGLGKHLMEALDLLVPALEARLDRELSGWGMLREQLNPSPAPGSPSPGRQV